MHRAGDGTGEAAGVIACGHRPGVLGGVELDVDHHLRRLQAQHIGHHLGAHGHVTLPGGGRGDGDVDPAQQVHRHGGAGYRAVLGPGLGPLLRGEHGTDVAHVGNRRLHNRRHANSVQPPGRARGLLALVQALFVGSGQDQLGHAFVVARVQKRAGRRAIRELIGAYKVVATQRHRVHVQRHGDAVDQPLQCVVDLGAAKAAHQAGGCLVGHYHPVAHPHVGDVIGTCEATVHTVKSGRFGRAQIGANLVDLIPVQGQDAAVRAHIGRDTGQSRRGRGCSTQVFQPVLNPFHRRAGLAGGQAHQHDIRKDRLLDAEAASGITRHAVAQLVARHLERQRHHRMQRKRAHEVGERVVAFVFAHVFGDHHSALDG